MERPLHILQVHGWWDVERPGGVITVMRDIADGLAQRGHHPAVLAGEWQCPKLSHKDGPQGAYYCRRLRPVPRSLWHIKAWAGFLMALPGTLRDLKRLCRKDRIDVIHLHYPSPYQVVFALFRMLGGPPYVITFHRGDVESFGENSPFQRAALRALFGRASQLVAVSDWLAGQAETNIGGIKRPRVVHNGTAAPQFDPNDALLTDLPVSKNKPFAIMVGVLKEYKGLDTGIRAWGELRDRGVHTPLLIFGEGPQRAELQDLIASLNLDDQVYLMGRHPREELLKVVAQATLLIAPSRQEGLPLMALESLLCGTPALCSDIGPFQEILKHRAAEMTFPVDDVSALAKRAQDLIAYPEVRAELADDLKSAVADRFSLDRMVDDYLQVYSETCGTGHSAPSSAKSIEP